jgi:hypothetical protein
MHMNMPGMGGAEHHGGMMHHRHHGRPMVMAFLLFHWLFYAAATTCFLGAINRAATALKTESRIKALKNMPDAFTEEEQMILIDKITARSLGGF